MKDAYICGARDEFNDPVEFNCIICDDSQANAIDTCESQATDQTVTFATMSADLAVCDHLTAANCTGWDPDAAVTENSSTDFDLDEDFVDAVIADPSQLAYCDGARVVPFSGFYQVTGASDGDFLYEVGLRNGDVIRNINSYATTGPFAVATAFFELWPGTISYSISVNRPGVGIFTITIDLV